MVYLSCDMDLQMIKMMKDAMMSNVQTKDGALRHTDYYSFNGIDIPFGRKTTNKEEKKGIYTHLKGRTMTLYEVRKWILIHSPFTFHARALGLLEKEGLLTVDSNGMKRRKGTFADKRIPLCWKLQFHLTSQTTPPGSRRVKKQALKRKSLRMKSRR